MDLVAVERQPVEAIAARETGDMPEIAQRAFERLERVVGTRGRRFYGYWDPRERAYFACAETKAGDDAAALGLERLVIPGGRYQRARLKGEPQDVYPRIGRTFEELRASVQGIDEERPWLEFYRARDEVDLLVPIG